MHPVARAPLFRIASRKFVFFLPRLPVLTCPRQLGTIFPARENSLRGAGQERVIGRTCRERDERRSDESAALFLLPTSWKNEKERARLCARSRKHGDAHPEASARHASYTDEISELARD